MPETIRITHRKLPHWEVSEGRYFVTVRCADSLPREAISRLCEVQATLAGIMPNSLQFAAHQREIFRTLEKYLDAGFGACPLNKPATARIVMDELDALGDWQCAVPHFVIMPNHWHALLIPAVSCPHTLSDIMKRIKGRTAKRLRGILGGSGAVWQREWFDRWARDDAEWRRMIAYIHNNPVKAGLVRRWPEHPWTR